MLGYQRGSFVVISGPDGSGKTTLINRIVEHYPSLIRVREPGGTSVSEAIRSEILSEVAKDWSPMSQLIHFFGARANLLERVVRPALQKGQNVIADRFDESTFAYQVVAFDHRELGNVFWEIRERLIVECGLEPNLYIYLDVPVEVGIKRRASEVTGLMNHLDKRSSDFHEKVAKGLREFFDRVPHKIVNGDQSPDAVLHACLELLRQFFGEPSSQA